MRLSPFMCGDVRSFRVMGGREYVEWERLRTTRMTDVALVGEWSVTEQVVWPLAAFLEDRAEEILGRTERAWESSILLFAHLTTEQRTRIHTLARASLHIWAVRMRQDPSYARQVFELGQEWGTLASEWQLHVYSFTKILELLRRVSWEYLTEHYPADQLDPQTIFLLGRTNDQILEDLRVPLMTTYLQQREVEMAHTRFSLEGPLTLPGRSLLLELANRLLANEARVVPAWLERVRTIPGVTPAMEELLERRGVALVELLLSLLQSPTAETSAVSLANVRAVGLESAQAGVSFREMFHALQQLRPILWDSVYEIYRREQYWHPAEFIEVLARLHLLLDLFSEGIGQAYLQQKEMIIQEQAEALHRRDLNLAREMLESLLPHERLVVPATDVGAVWIPSREIGGDFFDVFAVEDGDLLLLIGDVSGKGISAALLVSMVKYVIKANAPWHRSPATLLMVANRIFYQDMGTEFFVTMFLARYSPGTGRLIYSSAGHDPGFICRGGVSARVTALPSQGPILGVFPEVILEERRLWLQPDDIMLLYTDGLINVRCEGQREVTSRHLCAFIRQQAELPAQELAHALVEMAIAGCTTTDDITVLIAKRHEAAFHV
jgi:sigma-B regulation protein RsbU (phosphoserine phosphatase)